MGDGFYIVGIVLVVGALVLSFVGLREHGFPASRGPYAGVLAVLAGLVVATCAFAVALAREEVEHRAEEQAHAAEQAEPAGEEPPEEEPPSDSPGEQAPPTDGNGGGAAETLELTSPADGALSFDQDSLTASAGPVEIAYTNSSPVPHNVAIEADGETVAEGEVITGGDVSRASTELEPGSYVFFCSVPGHREAGMEGELTVE